MDIFDIIKVVNFVRSGGFYTCGVQNVEMVNLFFGGIPPADMSNICRRV